MGLEYISQPQVFLSPITAVGGIQSGLYSSVLPPLYTSFYTWTSTASVTASVFPLDGVETLTDRSGSYIVTVGGVIQSPTNYTVDPNTRLLTFDFNVNADTPVVITQIGTIATSAQSVTDLTATNSVFQNVNADSLLVTNLTALSSQLNIVNITQYELSGFDVQGEVIIDTDSSNPALRVTQRGSGNAIVVEDRANPDTTPFVVNETGAVGIGTDSPTYRLDLQNSTDFPQGIRIFNSNAGGNTQSLLQLGNDLNGAAAALVLNSSTNSVFSSGALILAHGLAYPIVFATSNIERMRIESTGNVSVSTTNPNQFLTVAGNISATRDIYLGNNINFTSTIVSIGSGASTTLTNTTTGNIYIGENAGRNITAPGALGSKNVYIGQNVAQNYTQTSNNVFIGSDAASGGTGAGPRFSVVVGMDAGKALTTGTANTFVGKSAGQNVTTGTRNIVIGADSSPGAAVNNAIVLGNGFTAATSNYLYLGSPVSGQGLSAIPTTTATPYTSGLIVNINGALFRIPLIPL